MSDHKVGPIPNPMEIELKIPVDVKMTGYATIRVPIDASKEDIDSALEAVNIDKMKLEPDDNKDGWFRSRESKHVKKLAKIGEVFKSFDKMNIAVVTNQCCSSCSLSECADMMSDETRFVGYAFIHHQDIEYLMESGKTHVGFGSRNPGSDLEIGEIVKQAFADAGFEIEWNGSSEKRIKITGFDQFKRKVSA